MKESEEGIAVQSPASLVSVIIPTYNRKDLLREVLGSLARQTYPSDRFEVIVVDDGSTDGTPAIAAEAFPFVLRHFWQTNQGDAAARNLGAQESRADLLVFLDDDILLEPDYLAHIVQAQGLRRNRIVMGTCNLLLQDATPFSESFSSAPALDEKRPVTKVPFTEVYSNNMALKREAYFTIGMMRGLDFQGSSMWCDLDFNYRAYLQRFEFVRSAEAICWHRDYAVRNLDTYKVRMMTAAFRSVILFQSYPQLLAHVPMFHDKTPIAWRNDSPRLIARKLARALASSDPALRFMEGMAHVLEKLQPRSSLLPVLYRYIVGGHVYQGYRGGLRAFGRIQSGAAPTDIAVPVKAP